MSDVLGYVVVEWNHPCYQPSLDFGQLHDLDWAHEVARMQRTNAEVRGRRERYTVHAVMAEEIEEGQ